MSKRKGRYPAHQVVKSVGPVVFYTSFILLIECSVFCRRLPDFNLVYRNLSYFTIAPDGYWDTRPPMCSNCIGNSFFQCHFSMKC